MFELATSTVGTDKRTTPSLTICIGAFMNKRNSQNVTQVISQRKHVPPSIDLHRLRHLDASWSAALASLISTKSLLFAPSIVLAIGLCSSLSEIFD